MSNTVIKVENLGKSYSISHQTPERYTVLRDVIARKAKSFTKKILSPLRKLESPLSKEEFWALKDVSFKVKQGEVLGIIGRNGAGKTTLLKILSRITEPTSGRFRIKGRVASLLEVGTGFHPELTGRENIFLNGSILGMRKAEIDHKFDEIVEFAEVIKFLDTPVKRYSSGMYVRLAFAVAAHLEPEILLVDEVLAVGDISFQKKCLGKMGKVARDGRTVLFVSHNMGAIRQLCPTCIWIDNGEIRKVGESSSVIESYVDVDYKLDKTNETIFAEDSSKEFQLRSVKLLNDAGILTQRFDCDKPVIIELLCQVYRRIPGLYGYLSVARKDGTVVMVSDSLDVVPNPLDDLPIGMSLFHITIPPRTLGYGDYEVFLNFTSQLSQNNFNVDSPGVVCAFHLDDFTSNRGNKRHGFFSTLLPWEVRVDGDQEIGKYGRVKGIVPNPPEKSKCKKEL
ncbi:ABC transporter ATP-binding protein [Thermodesulfobacteriota bacterium]